MTTETLEYFAPCPKHHLWHDLKVECFYCMVERLQIGTEQGNKPLAERGQLVR